MPRRFFHCWLCDIYYDIKDGKLVVVNIEEEMGITKEILNDMYHEESV